ncbi:MAG: AMP-dependent synthetase/ligase [Marinilabiliales bacterium]
MKTIISFFEESVKKYGNNPYIWEKTGDKYVSTSYKELQSQIYDFSAGLISLGLKKGDRVALISEGRKDWVIAELAILYAGAVNVPLSVKLDELEEIKFRVEHSESKFIIASRFQSRKIRKLRNQLPLVEKLILFDDDEGIEENEIHKSKVYQLGKEYLIKNKGKFDELWNNIKGNDYANICYTSGTTADPKGIILTHRNYTANVEQACSLMNIPEYYRTLLILPWDHSFAHTAGIYSFMAMGASIAAVQTGNTPMETLKNISINIKEIKPHILLSVPALAKNFRKNIEKAIRAKGKKVEKLFNKALQTAYKYNGNGWDKGKGFQLFTKIKYILYDKLIFSKIRENFGGNLQFFIGGGALLDIELQRFFYAIGIPMFQGYGLSEASPIISSNAPKKHKLGSSGFLVKNLELKICNENGEELPTGQKGEIVVKGENVMAGYWKNPAATKEAIRDGWLHTGDLGYMDNDGFLYVLGRFKSLLIANDGEKYSPEGIEEAFVEYSRYIDQCMLYNNQNAYTIALIVPNQGPVLYWLNEQGLSPETEEGQKAALKKIQEELEQFKPGGKYEGKFPVRWFPAAIAILDEPFSEQNRLLNSTLKMVRNRIVKRYSDVIEYLYTPEGKNIYNKYNIEAISRFKNNYH